MKISIRPVKTPEDFPEMLEVLNAANPNFPMTLERLQYEEVSRDSKFYFASFVAVVDGVIRGVVSVFEDPFAHRVGKLNMQLQVHPEFWGSRVGSSLFEHVLTHIKPRNAEILQSGAGEDWTRALRFHADRGFEETWRRTESRLQTKDFDFVPYSHLEEQIRAKAIEIKSFTQLEIDPARDTKLYDLDWALWQDVPYGQEVSQPSFENWQKEMTHDPMFEPNGCLIAVKDGEFIGYTSFLKNPSGFLIVGMTGVLREYRGIGLASLLKIRGIQYAQTLGNLEIRTFNDAPNTAMLEMNRKLGFVRFPGFIRFERKL
jgi:GNAT superfamily N-acetyltransferase